MNFNKYDVALQLSKEGIGREKVLNRISNRRFFNNGKEALGYKKYLNQKGIEVISSFEDSFPKLLKQTADFPLVLFTGGNQQLLKNHMITIVGTRKMTSYGRWAVRYVLKPLKDLDISVVSGLAVGIDSEVHQTCLDLNIPTIAIVAGGIDKGYPIRNRDLYRKIAKRGLILSEFPPGREVIKGMFPMRNRILAGVSSAVVIIESDVTGGSLITMNSALECGREVFAVPSNIGEQSLQGCNMCIAQGATPLYLPEQLYDFLTI